MDTCADVLIVIDLQNLLTKVNKRIPSYRKSSKPIIFIQHCDDDLVPEKNFGLFMLI